MQTLWHFFWQETGWVAKIVLGILLFFSVVSWAIMFAKYITLKSLRRQNKEFQKLFFQASTFLDARKAAERYHDAPSGHLFLHLYRTLQEVETLTPQEWTWVEKDLAQQRFKFFREWRKGLPFLATTAGVTPFIGLFGTVWGIMNAFRQIGFTGSSNLATVAPGISEALVNTAAGLFAAIPALIGYNFLLNQLRNLHEDNEYFSSRMLLITRKRLS